MELCLLALCVLAASNHSLTPPPHTHTVRAVVVIIDDDDDTTHRQQQDDYTTPPLRPAGVIMDLVDGSPLAEKPNATSVLRCRWEEGKTYPLRFVLSVGAKLAGALQHLHAIGVMHGDVYGHNVVATPDGTSATLLDYGASFIYTGGHAAAAAAAPGVVDFERLEVRALGLLLSDLLARCPEATTAAAAEQEAGAVAKELVGRCLSPQVGARPLFAEVARTLDKALREVCVVARGLVEEGGEVNGSGRIPAE